LTGDGSGELAGCLQVSNEGALSSDGALKDMYAFEESQVTEDR
jgi:hypothetical protein